ncbi:NPCBM/NEW2 domain-containing protein [Anatilimnocola sp. NA78]|uniref:NPCBM/NEW2 domain-containing protein n=1 Tax=Anatilimnocola sp. NA78 TaxID=3415683 RepID=UPI003CE590D3
MKKGNRLLMGTISVCSLLCLLAAAPAADVQVKLLRGDQLTGELVSASAEKLTIRTPAGEQVIPAPEVLTVDLSSLPEQETARVWLQLLDGSEIAAASVSQLSGKATIEMLGGDKLSDIPSRSIRAIRFYDPTNNELTPAWNEILAGTRSGDVLVLRKTATQEIEEGGQTKTVSTLTLDELEGTVLQIGPDSVKFDFDGDVVTVKREKLEGVVLFQPVKRELPAANLKMTDVTDSKWRLKSVEIADSQLSGVTPAGVNLVMPLSRVKQLNFSSGNVAMLAELPMELSEASGALLPKGLSAAATGWFGPLAGKRPGLSNNVVANPTASISLTGKSLATYRTPENFRWFRAGVMLGSKPGSGSDVDVVILGDGKELAKHHLPAGGERKPLLIEVDITGVHRLSLQAIPSSAQGLGALVDFQDARFTK